MANHASHAGLPYPIKGAKWSYTFPWANPDNSVPSFTSRISKDGGASAATTETAADLGFTGLAGAGWISLTAAEMNADMVSVQHDSGLSTPTIVDIKPRTLAIMQTGTLAGGAAGSATLPGAAAAYVGSILQLLTNTGAGQARVIQSASGNTATISPNWETAPDATTTYQILQCETSLSGSGGGGGGPTAVEIRQEMDSNSTRLAAIEADTQDIQSRLPATLDSGNMRSSVLAMATDSLSAAAVSAAAVTKIQANLALEATLTGMKGAGFNGTTDSLEAIRDRGDAAWITATGFSTLTAAGVWAHATRELTSGANIVLAKGTGVTGFNDLDAAGIRGAVGLGSANLDSQLNALGTLLLDIPTVAEFNARTLPSGDYATAATQATHTGTLSGIANNTDPITDNRPEHAGVPAADADLVDMVKWLFMLARNKVTQTANQQTLRNDADNANVAVSAHGDDGSTYTRGEWA